MAGWPTVYVRIAAGSFVIGDTTLTDVSADGSYADGQLTATRFWSAISPARRSEASGKLADLGTTPSGQISRLVDAREMGGVADVDRGCAGSTIAQWLEAAAPALGDAKLTAVVNAEVVEERTNANITLNGNAGGSAIDIALGLQGSPATWHDGSVKVSAAIENPDAGIALRQFGFEALPVRTPGRLRLTRRRRRRAGSRRAAQHQGRYRRHRL